MKNIGKPSAIFRRKKMLEPDFSATRRPARPLIFGPFVFRDKLTWKTEYVTLLSPSRCSRRYPLRCVSSTRVPQSPCRLPPAGYTTNFVTLSRMEFKFVIRSGDLPRKNLNINSRGICVAALSVDISANTPPLRHYPFKCNIGKAFRDEGDYELSQPLKPQNRPPRKAKVTIISSDNSSSHLLLIRTSHSPNAFILFYDAILSSPCAISYQRSRGSWLRKLIERIYPSVSQTRVTSFLRSSSRDIDLLFALYLRAEKQIEFLKTMSLSANDCLV